MYFNLKLFQAIPENTSSLLMKDPIFQHESLASNDPHKNLCIRPSVFEDLNTRRLYFHNQPNQVIHEKQLVYGMCQDIPLKCYQNFV